MLNSIIDAAAGVSSYEVLACLGTAILLGFIISGAYMACGTYTKSFAIALTLLPVIVQVVIMLVNGNLGVGVAVLGAFSLVRFRSVPGSAREISALFLAMAAGLATGMGYLIFSAVMAVSYTHLDVYKRQDYMIEKMINEDMLLELDHSKISNLVNMDEAYMDASYDPGNKYSVPYMWGTVGILYNTEKVNGDIASWDVLFDEQYKGEVYMLDSVRDSLGVALLKLGYSMNERDESKVNEAKELLIKQKKDGIVRAYDVDNIKKDMASGIGTLGVVYSGDAVVAMADNEALSYALPEGGTNIWYDAVVIPKNSDNPDLAHSFIDFLCRGDIAKRNVDEIGYCTPNKLAYEMLDDEIKDDKRIYPDAQYIEKCEVFQDLGELTEKYDEMWMVITGS